MRTDWSTLPADFLLELQATPGGRRRAQVEHALRLAIRSDRLTSGTRLPATRVLAAELGLSRGTIVDAYAQLAAEGYVDSRRGAGTVVAGGTAMPSAVDAGEAAAPYPPAADFRAGNPDLGSFPRELWVSALRRALRQAPPRALGYGDPRGLAVLRSQLAGHLARTRGVDTDAAHLIVCSGFTQALAVVCRALSWSGRKRLALEDPCLPQHREIVAAAGLRIRALDVDEQGARTTELAASDAEAVLLTPSHQAALGVTLSPGRRRTLHDWAHQTGGYIIDDDYDSEFRYDRQPVGSLQGLSRQRVIYAGTASKTLAPGVRLAWLAVPAELLDAVVEAKRLADRHTSALDQLALAELIGRGDYERHLRRRREQYRRRRDGLVTALLRADPRLRPRGIAAGLHALVDLPSPGPSEAEAVAHLAAGSVAVDGLGPYWHEPGTHPQALMINYASPPEHGYSRALDALGDGLSELLAG